MVEDLFGEEARDMYDVQILATNPAAQGRGYGTAMMRYVMDKACISIYPICVSLR